MDQAAPYGFDFDRNGDPQAGLAINGVEGYAAVPLLVRQLTLSGWVQHWFAQPNRVYLPTNLGRAALTFNGVYKAGFATRQEAYEEARPATWSPPSGWRWWRTTSRCRTT